MKLAVIKTGGKQYLVSPDNVLKIEKLSGKPKEGEKVTFDEVLLLDDGKEIKIGTPYVEGAKVEAVHEGDGRHKKIKLIKYKPKTRYRKRQGHRQQYSKVKITK
jgi:large subunit ribosomal protein L21